MKSNHRIRRMQRHNRLRARAVHLNLVSLIDVFAVLVFFLLLSASLAADRLNTLGLDLPSQDQQPVEVKDPKLPLRVIVHVNNSLEVRDVNDHSTPIAATAQGPDYAKLADTLLRIKKNDPKSEQITLLLEADVAYDTLVQVMDTARIAPGAAVFEHGTREMFPQISIGDATAESKP